MELTIPSILLAAKQQEIEELKRLSGKALLVGIIGHLIHALQTERGASSIYLGSCGERFAEVRQGLIRESEMLERSLNTAFQRQIDSGSFQESRQYYLMAWALLGLDSLPRLREQITLREIDSARAVAAFSRLIAGLVSLIFEVAHVVHDPKVSRALVGLFNFIQGKEHAGQERALGALSFASGINDARHQQRIIHLLEAQDRCFQLFDQFASDAAHAAMNQYSGSALSEMHENLRALLLATPPDSPLDKNLAPDWFDSCTERLERLWEVQQELVGELLQLCAERITAAERELQNTEGLIQEVLANPPASTSLVDRFFDPDINIDVALKILPGQEGNSGIGDTLVEMLLAQSQNLVSMERELEQARRALDERKIIEKAKGLLMKSKALSEEEAYKLLRHSAMEKGKRMIDLAAEIIEFQSWLDTAAARVTR